VVNRRHIRIKVMQTIYSMHQSGSDNMEKEEKFLNYSIDAILDLYLIMFSSLIEICKKETDFLYKSSQKHLATPEERNPNKKFVNNAVLKLITENNSLRVALENRKIDNWTLNDDYIILLLNEIKKSTLYSKYTSSAVSSFEEDREFVVNLFEEIIVPNEKLYDYLEDHKLTWIDDIPVVNTTIIKQLRELKPVDGGNLKIPKVFKDSADREFAKDLFRKTVLNEIEFAREYVNKTPNWDTDRIAEIDTIILKMAICELLKFPSIPEKVTMNEYLELAKEYSTPKSSLFINGLLDNLVKELHTNKRIQKIGRGLL
jgi:N utilization substance protein B